jgi:hypothetical protein
MRGWLRAGAQLLGHDLHVGHAEVQFLRDLPVGQVEAHEVQTKDPGPQRPMMASENRIRGSKPKPAEFLKPFHFNCLASATATSRALRAAVQSAHIGPLARHRPIPVMPVGNFPEKAHFRESNLLRHQVGSHPASIGDRSATHRFRESLVTTGSPLEQPDVQQHSQEHLTPLDT